MATSLPPGTGTQVAIFGAGIAGLTAAHELVRRGHRVSVYEAEDQPGGFFRSARLPRPENVPTEYSWHGMGPWYHNVFDLLRQIPFDATGTIYDRALSRPIDFGIFPDHAPAQFYDRGLRSIRRMFQMSRWELLRWAWLMLKTWCADTRTKERYARINGADAWRPLLGEHAHRTWRSCFGPWIGSDWRRCSLHTVGQFFCKQLTTRPRHRHAADAGGPAWTHGAGSGWLLLRGPSSEVWFNRWLVDLEQRGATFFWGQPLARLQGDGCGVSRAELASGKRVVADHYIVATTPFAAAEIFARTPELAALPELRSFQPLVQDGPHVQVSFRLGFAEAIRFPRERTAVVVADSEFNLTLFAQEQAWSHDVDLGEGIRSLWTGTSCVSSNPGRLYNRPVNQCTKEQFLAEVRGQILGCKALEGLVREANAGKGLADFTIVCVEVWHEWIFSRDGIRGPQPKWVNTTHTQPHQPRQITPVPNLFLAGAHTQTEADVWSIESAVESGRRAARGIDPRVLVLRQHRPWWLRTAGVLDNLCYRCGAPHLLDLLLLGTVVTVIGVVVTWMVKRMAG